MVQKIKAYAQITGAGADQLEQLFIEAIEHRLNDEIIRSSKEKIEKMVRMEQEILKAAGINPDFLMSPIIKRGLVGQFPEKEPVLPMQEVEKEPEEKIRGLDTSNVIMPTLEQNDQEEEDEDDEMFVGSLGGDEEEFEDMDAELSEEEKAEFLLPEEDEEEVEQELSEEEEDMDVIKDKNGNETRYEDDFMNDIQDEIDDFDDGMDDIMAAASASFKDDDDMSGGATASTSKVANDAPTGEDGFVPDILPTDFGMNGVAGDDKSAADFFTKAMMGQTGDTAKRNQIVRKRIKTSY